MLKIENLEVFGWEAAIRGMRNPKNSWDRIDSKFRQHMTEPRLTNDYVLGENDIKLASALIKGGSEHRKFLRMIHIQMDITAPMFWWAEFDTYKIATTRNSCSKMHTIHLKPFELDDFAHEECMNVPIAHGALINTINACDQLRIMFNETHDRKYWRALIELLPEGYMLKATWDGSYEIILNVLHQRENHKLKEEWGTFVDYLMTKLPYMAYFYNLVYGGKKE